jgi:5-hydroxyisourate hydrolase
MGRLTTHVLDLARGCPAAGLEVQLWRIDPSSGARTLIRVVTTNSDGRTDDPVLDGEAFQPGLYEFVFLVGSYFADLLPAGEPPFLTAVPVRFTIANGDAHYHVPLLLSPWGYTTYRGS